MGTSDYWTMKEIGRVFDTTSHKVGKKLKELGLRTEAGKPSRQAFKAGLCDQRWTQDMMKYCWAWKREEIVRLLQDAGFAQGEVKRQDATRSSRRMTA